MCSTLLAMGGTGGSSGDPIDMFEGALRRAEADADAIRAAGRADAARRLAAVETERREILTAAMYRVSLVLREAEARAAQIEQDAIEHRRRTLQEATDERDRLRRDASLEAKSIREDAAEEAMKLLSKLNTERDHILADARDDARRIVDAAYESAWIDDGSLPEEDGALQRGADGESAEATTADSDAPDVETPSHDDVWPVNLDCIFDDEVIEPAPTLQARGTWKAKRRRWYQPRR